jgi:hypothetical protein
MDGLSSDIVLEAIMEVMVEVDMAVVVEIAEGVGPTVDMDVSDGVVKSEVIDGVEVGISKSASEYSVGDPA